LSTHLHIIAGIWRDLCSRQHTPLTMMQCVDTGQSHKLQVTLEWVESLRNAVVWNKMPYSLLGIYYNFSTTLVNFYQTTWHYITEDNILRIYHCRHLKSVKCTLFYSLCHQVQQELIIFIFISRTDVVHEKKLQYMVLNLI